LPEADVADLPHILIVDDSRVVRMSIARHLKGAYEVREEGDGEAAWQSLVLDHSIRAVISDIQMPKLNGYELLERVRTSKLRRLQQLPFILVSGEETEDERAKASALGVSDFVTKGAGSAEILTRLNSLLALSNAQESLEAGRDQMVQDPLSGLFTRKFLELQAAQALSHSARHGVDASVMVFGFDGFAGLCERLGTQVAEGVAMRFAKMLAGKMRQEDSLGHFGAGQFAVVSPGTAVALCATFAERVREAVELARLSIQGHTVSVTVSIGLASVPVDQVSAAGVLLELAACVCTRPCGRAEIERSPAVCCRHRGRFRLIMRLSYWQAIAPSRSSTFGRAGSAVVALACFNESGIGFDFADGGDRTLFE